VQIWIRKEGVMQVLTIQETCNLLRVCRTTLWSLRKKGDLKGFNVGGKVLFTDEEVNAYIERQMQKGETT
jgi:excisionase family DNA binding protein